MESVRIEIVNIDDDIFWERNPKMHDIGALIESIVRYGFRDAPIFDKALNEGRGGLVGGNGRLEALRQMKKSGIPAPRGVLKSGSGEWMMPVQFGVDSSNEEEALAFAVDHNNLGMMGGTLTARDMSRTWDLDGYLDVLASLDNLPISVDEESLAVIQSEYEDALAEMIAPAQPVVPVPQLGSQIIISITDDSQYEEIAGNIAALFEEMAWSAEFEFLKKN